MYRDALLDELEPGRRQVAGPGLHAPASIQAPVDPNNFELDGVPGLPGRQAGGNYQDIFMQAAAGKRPTQASYAELASVLGPQGFQFQQDSGGRYRGRIQDPSGMVYDTNLNEGNDEAFMGGGEGTGQFGFMKRFHKSEVPGGWSAGGGGGGMSLKGMSAPNPMAGLEGLFSGSGDSAIQQGVAEYSEPSKYLEALLQQLQGGQS
jgi:hypothetical protein